MQSMAIVEYLEAWPEPHLLPEQIEDRARASMAHRPMLHQCAILLSIESCFRECACPR
jgi:glutathione S-transferase